MCSNDERTTDREYASDIGTRIGSLSEPSQVTDELFARMKEHFADEQLVEITALLSVVNLDRFNAAVRIGSAGFSEGMVWVPPDRPTNEPAPLARIA